MREKVFLFFQTKKSCYPDYSCVYVFGEPSVLLIVHDSRQLAVFLPKIHILMCAWFVLLYCCHPTQWIRVLSVWTQSIFIWFYFFTIHILCMRMLSAVSYAMPCYMILLSQFVDSTCVQHLPHQLHVSTFHAWHDTEP